MSYKEAYRKKQSYCSMIEFEQAFFPKSFREKYAPKAMDSRSIGIELAKDSFRKIKQEVTEEKATART